MGFKDRNQEIFEQAQKNQRIMVIKSQSKYIRVFILKEDLSVQKRDLNFMEPSELKNNYFHLKIAYLIINELKNIIKVDIIIMNNSYQGK